MTVSRRVPLLLAAVGLLAAAPGCVVPKSKYDKVVKANEDLRLRLDQADSDLAAAQDTFRKRVEELSREIDLYKKQATGSKAEAEKARAELEKASAEAKRFEDELRALDIGEVRDGRLILQGQLLFGLGEVTLSTQGKAALDKIARAFKGKDVLIQIDGHTDDTPIVKESTRKAHGENMGLSAHRALAVYRYLAQKGVPERKMYVRGFGEHWPVASNATAASKAKNRRVEILFIPAAMVPRKK